MHTCEICFKVYTEKRSLQRHFKIHTKTMNFLCDNCGVPFVRADKLKNHRSVCLRKRGAPSFIEEPSIEGPSTSKQVRLNRSTNFKKCDECNIDIERNKFTAHLNSLRHKKNCKTIELGENVTKLILSAFSGRVSTYVIENIDKKELFPLSFLDGIKTKVINLIKEELKQLTSIKFNMELFSFYSKSDTDLVEIKSFNSKNQPVYIESDIETIFMEMAENINVKCEEFQERESGWSLLEILYLQININKYSPLRGSTYIPLPSDIENKKACINIQNDDVYCFAWACLSCLRPAKTNVCEVSQYTTHFSEVLNITGLQFPLSIKDIPKFEALNENISVNVFGIEYLSHTKENSIIGPYYHTNQVKSTHINLLYIENNTEGHYIWIKDLSRLISSQLSIHHNKKFICNGCLLFFRDEQKLQQHLAENCNRVRTFLPAEGSIIEFKNFERQLKVPFVIYADFESILKPLPLSLESRTTSSTRETHEHVPASFGYYIKCNFNPSLSKYVSHRGEDCSKIFLDNLKEDVTLIYHNYLKRIIPMIPLTLEEQVQFENSSICFICEKPFLNTHIKVRDHCHLTGKFRGSAHNECNLNYKIPEFIPVFFHNMSGYDIHLFIKECGNYPDDYIQIIPMNKENYISVSLKMKMETVNFKSKFITIRFLDSFRFMASSIDTLVSTMDRNQFSEMKSIFKDKFDLLTRKGVYPYEYIDSWEKFEENNLPDITHFYNKMTDEHLSQDQYAWAQNIWSEFKVSNLGEYSDLYLKTDVILLADIFENFRFTTFKTYKLDPCHYYTTPGLSFDAMLRITKIQIEQFHDIEMLQFVSKGIRGGISQCSNRYGKANNQYLKEGYDINQKQNYLIYLDANNLYGWAMSQPLPYGGFTWLDESQICNINMDSIFLNEEVGYIFECDLTYPQELHDIHNDLPFCAENIIPPNGKVAKLIPNLNHKKKYIIHYENLKQCLKHGLKLEKIYRVLKFNQSPWLKKYINLNTELRKNAKSDFDKNQYKLYNNAIYGKTMENIDKRVDIKLANHWENNRKKLGAASLIAKPNFHSRTIFTNDLIAVQLNRTKILYNKPMYLGFCILELSKTLMYNFHYEYIKPKYGSNVKLLYTDTDSFVYDIQTEDFFNDIKPDISEWFDTSSYPSDNEFKLPILNKKEIGKMKDELDGKLMSEFVGLRSKLYALKIDGVDNEKKKYKKRAKGVNKSVIKKLNFSDYLNCLNDKQPVKQSMLRFKSIKHTLFTQEANKISLSAMDDKRFLVNESHDTLAWGHYQINNV